MTSQSLDRAAGAHTSSVPYRPAIDGLRAVAVLGVFLFHLNRQWLPGGFVGVDIFFVISGFLITSILLREYEHNSFSLWKFYQRRIARLFPALFTVALATLLAASLIYSAQDLASCGANLVSAVLSVANLKYMLQGNYFKVSADAQPLLHFWSLSVEEQFYMLFPALFLLVHLRAKRHRTTFLWVLFGASLLACIALTRTKPEWAFYLLPTRAWELLGGSILASLDADRHASQSKRPHWASAGLAGMALIFASLFILHEGPAFPGYRAVLPVVGAMLFLRSTGGANNWAQKVLSTTPMVFIGRMSYSLYLWHWPVFAFVDYKLYLASPLVRVSLKIALSAATTATCFFLIESPGRVFLNAAGRRRLAFAFLVGGLAVCVPLGLAVRKANYIDPTLSQTAHGGIVFNPESTKGSIVLMGDSNGAMYGKMAKEIALSLHRRLNVLSVPGEDPLPSLSASGPRLWLNSLAFVKSENPDVILLVCNWVSKLNGHADRLALALDQLKQHTRRLVLLTQPPELPESATREAMRNGNCPPFVEDREQRAARIEANEFVKSFRSEKVTVVDIESLFTLNDGSIRFAENDGTLLYHDSDHLSAAGAQLVKDEVIKAID